MKKNILHRGLSGGFVELDIEDYLTIEALEDGLTASLSVNACEYCVDFNGNWKSLAAGTATETINTGQTLSFRGNLIPKTSNGIGTFTVNKNFNLKGNVMSMLFGNAGKDNYSLNGKNYTFYKLFEKCTTLKSVSANFLPATTLAESCYRCMFQNCTNLTTAPELPVTTLANMCYQNMFQNCTSLTTAPALPATTLVVRCYNSMFRGCTSLTTAPALPATTLASSCYEYMFRGCTNLTTAPELPATTLATYCYSSMFRGCTSLTTAPALPATTLASSCYEYMFYGCTSLTTTPELPATTLANYCYGDMFYGCTKLNYIKMLATDISARNCLDKWVEGVASSGTFVKNPAMTILPTGISGIPSGWTVVNDGEESGGSLITFYIADSVGLRPNFVEYTAIEGMTWGEWIDSEYNTSDLYIDGEHVTTSEVLGITSSSGGGISVRSSDVIINGEKYRRG